MTSTVSALEAQSEDFLQLPTIASGEFRLVAGRLGRAGEDRPLEINELVAISEGLARTLPLWSSTTNARQRTWSLIAASATYEAWLIEWPPGGRIDLHDHGLSAGGVAVARGELRETTVVRADSGSAHCETQAIRAGESVRFGAHYVHDFTNVGSSPALSIHVYSPRLTAMTYFDLVEGRLVPGHTSRFSPGSHVP